MKNFRDCKNQWIVCSSSRHRLPFLLFPLVWAWILVLGRCSWCLCWWWWRDHTHSAEQPPVTLGQAGQSSAGRGLTSVEQRVWRLTHMQAADTECSAVYDDIQSDVMMQSDHIKWSLIRVMQGSYTAIWGAAPLWQDLLSNLMFVMCRSSPNNCCWTQIWRDFNH